MVMITNIYCIELHVGLELFVVEAFNQIGLSNVTFTLSDNVSVIPPTANAKATSTQHFLYTMLLYVQQMAVIEMLFFIILA